jgi:hypothetical protein
MKGMLKVLVFTVISVFIASCTVSTKIDWSTKGTDFNGNPGKKMVFSVEGGGFASNLWGTDVYTIDSSLATAAVHAGIISFEKGGTFTVEFLDGKDAYTGTERNGVTSGSWGPYDASFSVSK